MNGLLSLFADLVLQFALQLSKLPAVPLSLLLKRRLLSLCGLPQGWQLRLLLTHRSHQTLLLCLQSCHWTVHLLWHLAQRQHQKEVSDGCEWGTQSLLRNVTWIKPFKEMLTMTWFNNFLLLQVHLHLFTALQICLDSCDFSHLFLQLSPQSLHFKLLLFQLQRQPKQTLHSPTLHSYHFSFLNVRTPTFMSASCFIRSTSNDSCCLVLSTSSWVCCVADSILTVSALCHHIHAFSVATHSLWLHLIQNKNL